MKMPSARARREMERVAELRAGGAGWKAAAEAIGCDERVIRRWLVDYPDEWERLCRDAERRIKSDASNESLGMLRNLLRSKSSKVRLGAADKLANLLLKIKRTETSAESRPDLMTMAALAEEMSDEELEQCLNYFAEEFHRQQGAGPEAGRGVQDPGAGDAGASSAERPD